MLRYKKALHLAAIVLLLVFISGCYTQKKSLNDVDKAILKFPTETLNHIHELYPCAEKPTITVRDSADYFLWKNKVDSLNHYYDSLIESFSPQIEYDTLHITDSAKLIQCGINNAGLKKVIAANDEKIKQLNRIINNAPTIHDTTKIFQEDSLSHRLVNTQKDEISNLKLSVSDWKGKAHTREVMMWLLILIIGIQAYFNFRKLKIPFLSK